jgi:PAS domain S-box-containing protein
MNPYLGVPLTAAIACFALASAVLRMGVVRQLPNRLAATLMLSAGFWAACEVLWNAASDPGVALWLKRISAPGWVFLGPLGFHFMLSIAFVEGVDRRRWVRGLYAGAALFLLLTWVTPWMIAAMEPTRWGFAAVPGPLFPIWLGFTALATALGVGVWLRDHRAPREQCRGGRRPLALAALATLACAVALVDGVLPVVGVQLPRIGTPSLAIIGAGALWHLDRFGDPRLSPAGFSSRILRTLSDGIALVDPKGRIRLANERMATLIGCTLPRAEGVRIADHLDPDLLEPPRELREVASELRPIAGRPIPVCVSAAPLRDDASSPTGLVVIARDMREVSMLRDRLATSDRLIAVGQLAAGIAHEINNPLAFVRANLNHMRREWPRVTRELRDGGDSTPAREWGELIADTLDGIDRAAGIIRDVKAISHTGKSEQTPADLNALLDQVLRVAAPQFKSRVRLETSYGRIPPIPCAAQRLQQLFLNLVVNAAQAIDGQGVVRITTQRSGETVIASVEDDGCGISPEVAERIFDPFFTTKAVGEGSGLGLSISYEIVRSHGGEIWVESEPGRGSAFHVRLPIDPEADAAAS